MSADQVRPSICLWERTREAAEQEAGRVAESLRVEHLAEHARDKRTVHGHLPIHLEGQP